MALLLAAALLLVPGLALAAPAFPDTISLPDGFGPEGVVTGRGPVLYAGSIATGAIYAADLRTGDGAVLVAPQAGRSAVGLSFDARSNLIFVAGGTTGMAFVYDAASGATEGVYTLAASGPTFINDVIVTRDAAYFTDSSQPVLYRLPLSPGGGLPDPGSVEVLPLGGDFEFVPAEFNANGIEAAPNGSALIVVNTFTGDLYRVDPATGEATVITLTGGTAASGDGLLLIGRTLYVVQNFLNQVAVIRLDPGFTSGAVVGVITDPRFDIPTTVTHHGSSLYAVNARFTTPVTPTTTYTVVKVQR
jgi:sugar lactone lactonase YvrE